jgi:hypothetical protein
VATGEHAVYIAEAGERVEAVASTLTHLAAALGQPDPLLDGLVRLIDSAGRLLELAQGGDT